MEHFRFFNSVEGDERVYEAQQFAEYFAQFLSSGLYHQDGQPNLKVYADANRKVRVESGSSIIRGHMYKNDSNLLLDISPSHATLDRIDRVVLRYDGTIANRYIKLFVVTGEASASPVPPALIRTNDVYELSLAQIFVGANTGNIDSSDITDERFNQDVCGLTSSLITVPTDELNEDFNQFKTQLNTEFYNWFNDAQLNMDSELFNSELRLVQLNQLGLLHQRYLDGKSTEDMDQGLFFDTLSDTSKIDTTNTSAVINTTDKKIQMGVGNLSSEVVWKPHSVGFVTDKVTHFQTRPVNELIPLTAEALAGQNKINIASVKVTITEVI